MIKPSLTAGIAAKSSADSLSALRLQSSTSSGQQTQVTVRDLVSYNKRVKFFSISKWVTGNQLEDQIPQSIFDKDINVHLHKLAFEERQGLCCSVISNKLRIIKGGARPGASSCRDNNREEIAKQSMSQWSGDTKYFNKP